MGYQVLSAIDGIGVPVWWGGSIWIFKCPLNACIFMWPKPKNKVLTWDNLQKRGKQGPYWRALCKANEENILSFNVLYMNWSGLE